MCEAVIKKWRISGPKALNDGAWDVDGKPLAKPGAYNSGLWYVLSLVRFLSVSVILGVFFVQLSSPHPWQALSGSNEDNTLLPTQLSSSIRYERKEGDYLELLDGGVGWKETWVGKGWVSWEGEVSWNEVHGVLWQPYWDVAWWRKVARLSMQTEWYKSLRCHSQWQVGIAMTRWCTDVKDGEIKRMAGWLGYAMQNCIDSC